MESIYIYGAGAKGKEAIELIRTDYSELEIVKIIDRNKNGQELHGISIENEETALHDGCKVIIAIENRTIAFEIYENLSKKYKLKLFWFSGNKFSNGKNFFSDYCIDCELWNEDMLWQAEVHLSDACNLNCRGCAHYSALFQNNLPKLEEVIHDIKLLKDKFSHIVFFYLLGGEPFLNPEIGIYAQLVREILPNTEIIIVTNGLLIPGISDEILSLIGKSKIKVSISEYEPTHYLRDNITKKLEKANIIYEWREMSGKQVFNRPLSLTTDSKYRRTCISNSCVNIWNGKIARCPQLMYIDKFNEYFGTNLPNEGIMNLNDNIKGKELINKLNEEVPLCKHCIEYEIEWAVCGKNPKLSDFAAIE